jgi:hypothetical protein
MMAKKKTRKPDETKATKQAANKARKQPETKRRR